MLELEICPKCSGVGNLDWTTRDGGVCYKCEGSGYSGQHTERKDSLMKSIREKQADYNKYSEMLELLIKHLCYKIIGGNSSEMQHVVYDGVRGMFDLKKEYVFDGIKSEYVDTVQMPYIDNLKSIKSYSVNGNNSGFIDEIKKQDLMNRGPKYVETQQRVESLIGDEGFVSVEKIGDKSVKVKFNISMFN